MEIKLNKLTLENFKGIRSFTLDANGENCLIRGINASGKTSLMDAFLWLLFGKDSQGKTDFAIKTLDKHGQELHNLNHSVEAELDIKGQLITLKKVLAEKYTKKRGSARSEFTGHETQHFIDAVPIQKKEWDVHLKNLIEEDTFKLLTSPTYFNSLHWQKRREILLQVCGNISDGDVIASEGALSELPGILSNRSLEEHHKVVAAKKKEINDRLREIPARIDELSKSLALVLAINKKATEAKVLELKDQIQNAKDDVNMSNLRKQKAEWEANILETKTAWRKSRAEDEKKQQDELTRFTRERSMATSALLETNGLIESTAKKISRNEEDIIRYREAFKKVSAEEFIGSGVCPACGQNLPAERLQEALELHNSHKAQNLTDINIKGKALKTENETHAAALKTHETRKATLTQEIKDLSIKIDKAVASEAEYKEVMDEAEKKELDGLQVKVNEIQAKIEDNAPIDTTLLEGQLKIEQAKIAEIEAAKKTQTRIETLGNEEKDLAAEYEQLERQTHLMERFIIAKVEMLEGKINSKFDLVRFKLFEILINSGVIECCETTVNGVPWNSLNSGGQILGGLDIVAALQKYYQVSAPCWLDHRESLTTEPRIGCQLISLMADEKYKELYVELN